MRVAENRAVNRALRKVYGIGICSVEEIGSFAEPAQSHGLSPQSANGNYAPAPTRSEPGEGLRPWTFAGPKRWRSHVGAVEKSVSQLADWARKTATPCSASSTVICQRKCGMKRRPFERLRPASRAAARFRSSSGASPRVSPPADFLWQLKGNARGETRFADSRSGVHVWRGRRLTS